MANRWMFLTAAALLLFGLGAMYYGFELVTVPGFHDAHERFFIGIGFLITLVGAVAAFAAVQGRNDS